MARIDVDDLRDYLLDYCGTAAFRVSRGACRRRPEIERASGLELCGIAQRLGVDPEILRFDAAQTGLQHERMGCIEVTFQAVATAFASA